MVSKWHRPQRAFRKASKKRIVIVKTTVKKIRELLTCQIPREVVPEILERDLI